MKCSLEQVPKQLVWWAGINIKRDDKKSAKTALSPVELCVQGWEGIKQSVTTLKLNGIELAAPEEPRFVPLGCGWDFNGDRG